MSIYSGRCDVYDVLMMIGEVTDFSKVHIYVGHNPVELRIDSYKDLIPYFPFTESLGSRSNGEYCIHLSSKPSYRRDEEDMLKIYIRDLITCYNKLKREKNLSLDTLCDLYISKYVWQKNDDKNELYRELAKRVLEAKGHKERVDIDDITLPMGNYFRKRLYDEMVANGWDEFASAMWCYGWSNATRMLKLNKKEEEAEA